MKSYFAKLADRATLPNVPATSTVYAPKLSDPFEAQKPEPLTPPPPAKSRSTEQSPVILSETKDLRNDDGLRGVEKQERRVADEPAEPLSLKAKRPPDSSHAEPIPPEVKAVTVPKDIPSKKETEVTRSVPSLTPTTVEPQAARRMEKATDDQDVNKVSIEERLDHLEQQSLLLRKADDFMSRLLDVRPQPVTKQEERVIHETIVTAVESQQSEPVNRIEPSLRETRPAVSNPEGPSLVIGTLTLEVAPPTQPAAAPQQPPRIVVRGSAGRSKGLISSRRFGLRQF